MRAFVLSLAAAAALSGCGGSSGNQPRTLPPVSPSASPPPVASEMPTGIAAPTPEGATEFAKFFYAQIAQAFTTKNPALIQDISLASCKACQLYIGSITRLRDNNERATGAEFHITFAQAPAVAGDEARVSVIYDTPPAIRYSASGKALHREPALRGAQDQVILHRRGGSWVVAEVQS